MSVLCCGHCGDFIDTDDDPAAFIEAPTGIPYNKNLEQWVCEPCRERAWDRQNERAMEG